MIIRPLMVIFVKALDCVIDQIRASRIDNHNIIMALGESSEAKMPPQNWPSKKFGCVYCIIYMHTMQTAVTGDDSPLS